MEARNVLDELQKVARPDKAAFLPKFFQAYPGGYGEGDQFLGCVVPAQRAIAKRFRDLSIRDIESLLHSPWHECRLTALFILTLQFDRAMKSKDSIDRCKAIIDFYLANLPSVNNWDLVDASAPAMLGKWLIQNSKERKLLGQLATSQVIWERRVAVVATMPLIRAGDYRDILKLAKKLLSDDHDLMHKAVGWMLREVWKKDPDVLRGFLLENVSDMPRTTLRYCIERMKEKERLAWLRR